MNALTINNLAWLYGEPQATGIIKQSPDDFVVVENIGYEPDGEGEHLLVRVRKTGCNTQFVAERLAKFAGIPQRSVSYAGLKDRHAVTEQWFCLHLPGKDDPDMAQFTLEGCEILSVARHRKKIRIGNLKGNAFHLTLRQISDRDSTEARLRQIAANGVPNYFGEQRFGRDGNNLVQAVRWAKGEINVKERQKRSFYLSALRSALFNQVASARISQGLADKALVGDAVQLCGRGSWFVAEQAELEQVQRRISVGELYITAPLPGDGQSGALNEALLFEQRQLAGYGELLTLLHKERLESARRAILVRPQDLRWQWPDDNTLALDFSLPAGSFATSLVRELIKPADK